MDYNTLATELTTDPLGRGYSSMTSIEAADDLNTKYRTRIRPTVSGSEILNATDDAEFSAVADPSASDRWLLLCGVDAVDTSNGVAKSLEATLFGPGTTTRANLAAIRQEAISRAEELALGEVLPGYVEYARSL